MGADGGKRQEVVVIVCAGEGCGKVQRVRRSRVLLCDGYACCAEHVPGEGVPPGRERRFVVNAAGGFTGWRDVAVDEGRRAEAQRAHRLALLGLAQSFPWPRTVLLLRGILGAEGVPGTHHLLVVNDMSTALHVTRQGGLDVELPTVAGAIGVLLRGHGTAAVILRTFAAETFRTTARGVRIPVKRIRGWLLAERRLTPLPAAEVRAAYGVDADSGAPLAVERDLVFCDAWEVPLEGGS
ncbi:hypothetical protein ACFQLX_05250 [Streptomyces polyrhachis]|uniref:Uncharacterized protein n=1 Tax=Streptomyces polyrhachis TaxID=1282885 RepID=A0ABW2G9V1_9ACTN